MVADGLGDESTSDESADGVDVTPIQHERTINSALTDAQYGSTENNIAGKSRNRRVESDPPAAFGRNTANSPRQIFWGAHS